MYIVLYVRTYVQHYFMFRVLCKYKIFLKTYFDIRFPCVVAMWHKQLFLSFQLFNSYVNISYRLTCPIVFAALSHDMISQNLDILDIDWLLTPHSLSYFPFSFIASLTCVEISSFLSLLWTATEFVVDISGNANNNQPIGQKSSQKASKKSWSKILAHFVCRKGENVFTVRLPNFGLIGDSVWLIGGSVWWIGGDIGLFNIWFMWW